MKLTKKQISIGLIAITLIACFTLINNYLRNEKIKAALELGRLSPIPKEASNVRVSTEGGLFSRTFYLTFQATDASINKWIKSSESIQRLEAVRLTEQEKSSQQVYLFDAPSWFDITSIHAGQVYNIPQDTEANYGTIFIDRETKRVYIKTSHS